MNDDVHFDDIRLLLEISNRVNGATISLTRCLIFALLSYFADGIQYTELKTALNISDGKLISNLNRLREMQYIEKSESKIDRNEIDIYTLSEKGRTELDKIIDWMELIKKVGEEWKK